MLDPEFVRAVLREQFTLAGMCRADARARIQSIAWRVGQDTDDVAYLDTLRKISDEQPHRPSAVDS